ncbi:cell division protein FtsL [Psittacicella gerlachiana]|uniref:cell division protein FtsL n=1 Tax=Psittacicella gerlachiana TaxID=2028574 RepID=UPI001CA7284E|nr:cell division protein FtsL [Psittacicella gerlachiana]
MNFFKATKKKSLKDKSQNTNVTSIFNQDFEQEKITNETHLTKKEIDDASKANGTAVTDLIDDLEATKYEQSQDQQKHYAQEAKESREKYITETYGKLNWNSDFTPLKILYKDFSTKFFLTLILFIVILSLALVKIYITRVSIDTTIQYSKLLADKNSLNLSNDNLRLEFLSLTSKSNIIRITSNKISLIPISTEAEVIVIIPYLPNNKTLSTTSIPFLTPPQE